MDLGCRVGTVLIFTGNALLDLGFWVNERSKPLNTEGVVPIISGAQDGNYSPPPVYAFQGPPAASSFVAEVSSLDHVLWVPQAPAPSP